MPLVVWSPNGAGAGTDNKTAGGGGGFWAVPQPPQGTLSGYVPVENYGQFQALTYTPNFNAIGVSFTISCPGRSA